MDFNEIWPDIPKDVRWFLDSQSKLYSFKRGEKIYHQDEKPKGIYFVNKGLVGLTILGSSSGKEHLLRFFKQGQFFGHRALFSNENYHANTMALEPTSLKLVPKDIMLSTLEKNPHLYRDILTVLAKELRHCELQRVMILENQILSRVAQSLVYLKDLHPEHNWTRQEIANFCASTVSTVIKALAAIEEKGLIRQDGRSINIVDREGLIHLQDEFA
jgi:CRP-like cAMP-binding protein